MPLARMSGGLELVFDPDLAREGEPFFVVGAKPLPYQKLTQAVGRRQKEN
jgi:hypothetical protein